MKETIQKLRKYPLLVFFFLLIFLVFVVDVFVTGKEFSEMENRYLKQSPHFTVKSLINNEYTKEYELFVNDQFAFRDQWITLKSVSEIALCKIENNGVAYGREGYLIPRLYDAQIAETRNNGAGFGGDGAQDTTLTAVSEKQISTNMAFLNRFLAAYEGHVTVAIAPNAYEVLPDMLPRGMENAPQAAYIGRIYGNLQGGNLATLDLLGPMSAASLTGQAYYRTDHHWTTDGAWAAYAAYAQSRSLPYVTLEELAPLRHEAPDFLGTNYSKTKNIDVRPDTLVWYDIPTDSVTIDGETGVEVAVGNSVPIEGLYYKDMFARRDKYAAFLYGNHGLTVIKSGNNLGHAEGETSRIMIIKDSYGNCLAPFFTYSFDEVYVVDLRAMPIPMSRLVAETEFDDILFVYNFTSFQQDKNVARINF